MKTQVVIFIFLWGVLACGVKGDPQPPEKPSVPPLLEVAPTEEGDDALNEEEDKRKKRRQ